MQCPRDAGRLYGVGEFYDIESAGPGFHERAPRFSGRLDRNHQRQLSPLSSPSIDLGAANETLGEMPPTGRPMREVSMDFLLGKHSAHSGCCRFR